MDMRCYRKIRHISYKDHVTNEEVRAKIQQEGTVKGGRRQGRQKKRWEGNISEMDRPVVRQVPEGSGEQGKMEKTGCKINCGAPTTLAVKGLMMMMMMSTGSCVGPQNKIGHPAHRYRQLMQVPVLFSRGR